MTLEEAYPEEIAAYFPVFFSPHAHFFWVRHQGHDVGVYGVNRLSAITCSLRLYVFEDFRFKIPYKQGLILALRYPFSMGYLKILISSREKAIITLLKRCQKLGVSLRGWQKDTAWFEVSL